MRHRLIVSFFSIVVCACSSKSAHNPTPADASDGYALVFLDAGPTTPVSPAGASSCPVGCNYQTQAGCSSGEMCHPQLNGDTVSPGCVSAGTLGTGQGCTWQQCLPGFFCASDQRCHHLCCAGDWSVCGPSESCTGTLSLQASDAGSPTPAGVGVCEPVDDCDVFDPDSCPMGKSCYIVDSRAGTRCLRTGTVQFNGVCNATKLCAPGLTCTQNANGTSGTCRRLCRAVEGGGEPSCPESEGRYCAHFVRDPAGVGECTPTL